MICKSTIFCYFSALILLFVNTSSLSSQSVIDPTEIKEALVKISADAKDTLKLYSTSTASWASARAGIAFKIDSLAVLHQEATKLTDLFRKMNEAFDKVPPAFKFKFKGDGRKRWIRYQTANAISGGKWRVSVLDGVTKPPLFGTEGKSESRKLEYPAEVQKLVAQKKKELASAPHQVILSFPVDGAFNTYINQLNGVIWGYYVMNKAIDNDNPGRKLAARFTSNKGDVIYTLTQGDYNGDVHFIYPHNYLTPGGIYKLELVWVEDTAPLKPYWDASCFGGLPFYNFDLASVIVPWVGESGAICPTYFRVSEYANALVKLYKKGRFDPSNNQYMLELDEPLDSFEVYGVGILPPQMKISDDLTSDEYERIFKPSVVNYFLIPRTGKVDTVDINTPHPFEQAGLIDQSFVYEIGEGVKPLGQINPNGQTILRNNYTINGVPKTNPVLRIKGALAPRITQQHFSGKLPIVKKASTLIVETPKMAAFEQQHKEVKLLLEKRIKERALFFYCMQVRSDKRAGKKSSRSLLDFENTEREHLSPSIKALLTDPKITFKQLKPGVRVFWVNMRMPGTTQQTASFSWDFTNP